MIALSCGIKISAVYHLHLSQSTRVTDGQTDRITTQKTAHAYARAVKPKKQLYQKTKDMQIKPNPMKLKLGLSTVYAMRPKNGLGLS